MKPRLFYWLLVPLLVGVMAYFVSTGWQWRRVWSSPEKRDPVLDCPSDLDLGQHEMGEQVVAPFRIANQGGAELVVDQIQTNCSCTGMEREQEGRYYRVESLRLKAGEHANLVMRVSVRGVPVGADMLNVVQFQSNDPTRPHGRIEVVVRRITGGVSSNPPSVIFETVPVGEKACRIVEVRDTAVSPRIIERVTSNLPERVTVRLLPLEKRTEGGEAHPDGALIGRVEVTVNTASAGEVHAAFQIHLAGEARHPDAVTVAGRVAALIEISPSSLVLPRTSATGPIYDSTCICRSTSGKALTLKVESLPPGLTGEILAGENSEQQKVRIALDPQRDTAPGSGHRRIVRFRARAGEEETVLDLPVLIQK